VTAPVPGGRPALLEAGLPGSDPLAARLFPQLATGVEWGLERVRTLLAAAGDPHLRYPTLHIGGTNGKGSVSATLASVLRASGLRVGLYTSPHLCSFSERIQVDGIPADARALIATADLLRESFVAVAPTFFEAATVLALAHFAREGVDVAVLEVGLGGRLDATNVVRPLVTAITGVAMDHTEYLGPTLPEIAREKAGIAKAGIPLLTAETDPEVREVFRRAAERVGAPFHPMDSAEIRDVELALDHTAFTLDTGPWGTLRLRTPLPGMHQAVNTALAVRVLEALPSEMRPSARAVLNGVGAVRWPGRLQVERVGDICWVLDVAHNVAGASALAAALDRLDLPPPRVVVAGVLGDKDWRSMLPQVFRLAERAILTQPPSAPAARRWDPSEAAAAVREDGVSTPLEIEPDFVQALERARVEAAGGTVVVTGSCHTVGDALLALGIAPYGPPGSLADPPAPGQIGAP
jgi:dihydrofolate synthase / folylpolyglutamate synthase